MKQSANEKEYSIVVAARTDYLHVRVEGTRTSSTVSTIAAEVMEAALARNCARVLIDVRNLEGTLGILGTYRLVTEKFAKLRGRGIGQAAVLDDPTASLRLEFLETVARNRGFNLRSFTDETAAMKWIG